MPSSADSVAVQVRWTGHIIKFELQTALHIGSEAQDRVHRLIPVSVKWKTTVCLALLFEYIIKIELQTAFNARPIPVSVKQKTTVCSAFLFEHITKIELQTAFNVRPIPVSVKQKNTVCSAFLFDHIIKIELQTAFNVSSKAQDRSLQIRKPRFAAPSYLSI
ncbi:hypothetical protein B0H13DRAFT_1887140 [Mycena leptocephala]|nr:hypothetical protein B0H13DRAFT_1887140 [Mycena leptocephala]